ncbi:MAG: TadE/TadG family type IV pilus assembly protein [Candidatus Limnocylindria bacterium]
MIARSRGAHITSGDPRGQSLVEFGLVLPLLLVLLIGIADLGRVFASAITLEAATRNAAEAAAQEYVQIDPITPAAGLDSAGYQSLHDRALEVACREAERLPERILGGGGNCLMPIIGVCVHDDSAGDAGCGSESTGAPGECTELAAAWSPARLGPDLSYVEVRICYQFDLLISVPLADWGTVWLQKANVFTVANYCPPLTGPCPP